MYVRRSVQMGARMKKTLGQMLWEAIETGHVSQTDLCRGLCSTSALSRYLSGERRIDRLLLTALMQRLGLSPDKFGTVLTDEEYRYFDWKQRLASAQIAQDWEKASILLEEDAARDRSCNQVLQEQFYLLMQGVVQKRLWGNREKSIELIEQAVRQTVPEFPEGLDSCLLLSVQEISAMLLWQGEQPDEEMAAGVLRFLEAYTLAHYHEERELVKLYPKVAARYLPLLYRQKKYFECLSIGKKAMDMMVSTGYASSMETVLEIYVSAAEESGLAKAVHRKRVQLTAWKELMRELGHTEAGLDDELYMMDVWQEVELLDERISRARQEQGYSQEALSEDICTPETLSRIETGRRAPSRKTYQALAKKLSLEEAYYYCEIETDDFAVLDKKNLLDRYSMNREWEQVEKAVEELAKDLDLSHVRNRQYVEEMRCIVGIELGRTDRLEAFERFRHILALTVEKVPESADIQEWDASFWQRSFTFVEISVMIQMADALFDRNWTGQAACLMERLMEYYRKSRVKPEFHFRTVILIVARLSSYYGILKEYDKALQYAEEGIRLSLVSGTRKMLAHFVNNKGAVFECRGDKKAALHYYKQAFYIAELLEKKSVNFKAYYEKLAGREQAWY